MACINSTGWNRTDEIKPDSDLVIDWISPSGDEITGGRYWGAMWYPPPGEMYVYYTPIFWRPSKESI